MREEISMGLNISVNAVSKKAKGNMGFLFWCVSIAGLAGFGFLPFPYNLICGFVSFIWAALIYDIPHEPVKVYIKRKPLPMILQDIRRPNSYFIDGN